MSSARGNILVVGDNDLAGLTTVRSLGRAGHRVSLVAFEPSLITRRSRYVRRVHDLGHPLRDAGLFVAGLLELLGRERFDLVIPTSDKSLVPLLPWRSEVESLTRFAVPDEDGFRVAYHKDETVRLALELGVPVPRTQVLRTPEDLTPFRPPDRFPVVLKPACSVSPGVLGRNEVAIVRSADELGRRLPALLRRGTVLVQEFCAGHGVGLSVLARRGEVFAAFQHERVHEPPQGGASSYRKSVPLSADLLDAARRMCAALKWTGPAMFEFKVDPDRGSAMLMEINGRLWGSLSLAVQAGVDFPRLLHDLFVHDQARPAFDYKVPFYVRHTTRDLYWLRDNWRTPPGRKDLLRRSTGQLIAEAGHILRGREGYDLESLSDPLPALAGWLGLAGEVLRGLGRRASVWWHGRRARRISREVRLGRLDAWERLRRARSVLFVCLGNVNRSAFAAAALSARLGRVSAPVVWSAGLLPEGGRSTGPVSLATARGLGVDLTAHRSTPLTRQLLEEADVVLAMEAAHLPALRRLLPSVLARTYPLSAFQPDERLTDIADPEGSDAATFTRTYETILRCLDGLARAWHAAEPYRAFPPKDTTFTAAR
jgi:predicted ATP-grasp superfamily ATP-dependent carboligase/protein-tyrosine-phosphatase